MGDSAGGIQELVDKVWDEVRSPLYRNALFLMMNTVVAYALGFFFWWIIIVAHVYSTADIGFAVALFSTVSFVGTLSVLGLSVSIVGYLPEAEDKPRLLNTSLTLVGLAALLIGAAFLAIIGAFDLNLSFVLGSPVYLAAIVLGGLGVGLGAILDNAAIGLRRADVTLWRNILLGLLKIPIAIAIAFTMSGPFGVGRLGVFLALVIGTGVSVLVEGYGLLPRILAGYRPRPHFEFRRLRPMFHFSAGNYVAISTGAAGSLLLTPLILEVMGPNAVTYFYVGSAVAGLLGVIPSAAFASFYAEASQKAVNGADRHRDERRAILLSVALLIPAILVMWFFAHFLLFILFQSKEYADNATGVLQILVFAAIPAILANVLVTRVRIRKRSLPLVVGATIGTGVTLGLGYGLLQSAGINGLAVAALVGGIAPLPYYWLVARKPFAQEPLEPSGPAPIQP